VLGPSPGSANIDLKLREFGVYGYLSKDTATAEELVSCVRRVAAGGVYFDLDDRSAVQEKSGVVAPDLKMLSRRQVDVLLCIAEGLSSKQIGLKLGTSVKTVESHRTNLMERLNIFDVASLVKFAITSRLIKLEYDPMV